MEEELVHNEYEKEAEMYDTRWKDYTAATVAACWDRLEKLIASPGLNVLDVGCGTEWRPPTFV